MSSPDVVPRVKRLAEDRDRQTKIVATIGPATSTEEALRALLQAGMDVARLNFSHGTPEEHRETIQRLRRLAETLAVPVAILQDLSGPKVRIGAFADGTAELRAGAPFTLTTRSNSMSGSRAYVERAVAVFRDEASDHLAGRRHDTSVKGYTHSRSDARWRSSSSAIRLSPSQIRACGFPASAPPQGVPRRGAKGSSG